VPEHCSINPTAKIVDQSIHQQQQVTLSDKVYFFCSLSFWQGMNDSPNEYIIAQMGGM